jgi:hypothetical protein
VIALILLAAIVGLFGSGLLSQTVAGQRNSALWVEYDRFWRMQSPMFVRLHFGSKAIHHGQAHIWLSRSYLEDMSIQYIMPQPLSEKTGPQRVAYAFAAAEAGNPTAATFNMQPETFGSVSAGAGLRGGREVSFTHFIYP